MAKFCGNVGYVITTETKPGVWTRSITEIEYFGDVTQNTRRVQPSENLNDNVVLSNVISIVADPFAYENFHLIVFVVYMGIKWKVSNIGVLTPRLTLTIGEVYNDDDGAE